MFLILLLFVLSFNQSFAQELSIKETTITPTAVSKKVDYQLPYPGLLPDNPLYFTKVLRDAIVDFLISDPLKKADFYLLQADKRLNAGAYLLKVKKDKKTLAESTISKGENYFEKALVKTTDAKRQGMDIKDISSRLWTSSKKHQEVLKELNFETLLKRAKNFEKQAKELMSK
ncbi:hypothetical protein HY041_00415 [Candidatus Roizmanbacteria bacterium]|nr:hypothetical protein [Candidatus Roizmanbacteria bacterium]